MSYFVKVSKIQIFFLVVVVYSGVPSQESSFFNIAGSNIDHTGPDHSVIDSKSYSSGLELTNLAHSSAFQAKSAVQSQGAAGSQAAFGAKKNLAHAAFGAATTAQAALFGKQLLAHSLERQLADAEYQLQAEISQYQQTEAVAHATEIVAQQSQKQVSVLATALSAAQESVAQAIKAASEASSAAASQHSMIQEFKQKVTNLANQLHNAVSQLEETENAAQNAAVAAQLAHNNAEAAANVLAENEHGRIGKLHH